MHKLLKIIALFFALASLVVSFKPPVGNCLDSQDSQKLKVVQGHIAATDWVGQTIVVKWFNTEGRIAFDELTIFMPDNIKITRGTDTISLSDLNIGDEVTVEYYNTSPGPLKAVSVNVKI